MKRVATTVMALLFIVISFVFFDKSVVLYFHQADFFSEFFQVVTEFGKGEIYLVPSFLLYIICRKKAESVKRSALLVFGSVALSGIAVNILKIIFGRYRPKMLFAENLYGFTWFHLGYSYASFPSGHSTTVFSAFVALAFIWPKYKYLFYALAVFVAFSRIAIGAHYPSDVVAGALLGTATAMLLRVKYFKEINE